MSEGKLCANCGTELKENALFCGNCGAKVATAVPSGKEEAMSTEEPKPKMDKASDLTNQHEIPKDNEPSESNENEPQTIGALLTSIAEDINRSMEEGAKEEEAKKEEEPQKEEKANEKMTKKEGCFGCLGIILIFVFLVGGFSFTDKGKIEDAVKYAVEVSFERTDRGHVTRNTGLTCDVQNITINGDYAEAIAVISRRKTGISASKRKYSLKKVNGKWAVERWVNVNY